LDQPPPGEPSRGFLSGEGARLDGLMSGPRSPRALGAGGGICPLVSRRVRDLVGGVGDGVTPIGQGGIEEPPEPWMLGVLGSSLALGLD
jgi:hypothetical protein